MDKDTRDKRFIRKPIYPGGQKAYKTFISNQMKYPKEALEHKVEGYVQLKYDINHLGKVISTKIISSLGHGCDEEAIRIVSLLQFEIPKGPRKLKITFHKTVRIHFKLPATPVIKPKKKVTDPAVTYHVTTTLKSPAKNPVKIEGGANQKTYTYQITLT